jgi:hypothetical protein
MSVALDFPASPTLNQVYTAMGRSFIWNGTVWLLQSLTFPWATQAQVDAGTNNTLAVSALRARARADQLPQGGVHPFSGTPTNMLAQRAAEVNYRNTLGRPMLLSAWGAMNASIIVGPNNPANQTITRCNGSGSVAFVWGLVPRDWWYRVQPNAGNVIQGWVEYR